MGSGVVAGGRRGKDDRKQIYNGPVGYERSLLGTPYVGVASYFDTLWINRNRNIYYKSQFNKT